MRSFMLVMFLSSVIAAAGCSSVEPDGSVILSVTRIDAPATVSASASFTVTLTVETGGCRSFDRLAIEKFTSGVRIVPWGTELTSDNKGIMCPTKIYEPHSIRIDPPLSNPFQVYVAQGQLAPVVTTVQVQ